MSEGEQIVPFWPQALMLCWAVGWNPHLQSRNSRLCHSWEPNGWVGLTGCLTEMRSQFHHLVKIVSQFDSFSFHWSLVKLNGLNRFFFFSWALYSQNLKEGGQSLTHAAHRGSTTNSIHRYNLMSVSHKALYQLLRKEQKHLRQTSHIQRLPIYHILSSWPLG